MVVQNQPLNNTNPGQQPAPAHRQFGMLIAQDQQHPGPPQHSMYGSPPPGPDPGQSSNMHAQSYFNPFAPQSSTYVPPPHAQVYYTGPPARPPLQNMLRSTPYQPHQQMAAQLTAQINQRRPSPIQRGGGLQNPSIRTQLSANGPRPSLQDAAIETMVGC